MRDKCPKCKGPIECLAGESAHPRNWYCADERGCGWAAWNNEGRRMKIEDVVRDMREAVSGLRDYDALQCGPDTVREWADALEQYMDEPKPSVGVECFLREIGRLEQHLKDARQFDPPREVIENWPDDSEWILRTNYDWVCLPEFITSRHLIETCGADPRTLHHRSKFYPEAL